MTKYGSFADAYHAKKNQSSMRGAEIIKTAQDIGEIPAVVDPDRRNRGIESLEFFCRTYFNSVFKKPFSKDHIYIINKIERVFKNGDLFALAAPRGTGKTVLSECGVIWGALSGLSAFTCIIAASADRAKNLLETIKLWLETNDLLNEDFPEVCYPVRKLERITHRQKGQKYHGVPTRIQWGGDKIVLPYLEGLYEKNIIISCSGMNGSDIRGQNFATPGGVVVRPTHFLVDDPQTRESAWSPSQCDSRESILSGDVLGMAGPGEKIAGLVSCTIIRRDDLADRILDRKRHPEWRGEKMKLVYQFPENEKLWTEYGELRNESLRNDGDGAIATEFYKNNRTEMDKGAEISWPERYNNDEISAIQHAMNLRLRDETAFFAEYQNDPIIENTTSTAVSRDIITEKINHYERGIIPLGTNYVTAFIDVHEKLLYFSVIAWRDDFTGNVVDYGTWPDQGLKYFSLVNSKNTLAMQLKNAGLEAILYNGLSKLSDEILGKTYYREDGTELHVDRCLIDANWGQSTDIVYQFCKQSRYSNIVLPSHGKFIGASSIPFSEYRKVPGDKIGTHWRIPSLSKRQVRKVLIDTNYWKSFIHERLGVPTGDIGCLSIFGNDSRAHHLLADHLTAEYSVRTESKGKVVDEWKNRPSNPDNHWFDCFVGCAVGASICGAKLISLTDNKPKKEREIISFSELQKNSR